MTTDCAACQNRGCINLDALPFEQGQIAHGRSGLPDLPQVCGPYVRQLCINAQPAVHALTWHDTGTGLWHARHDADAPPTVERMFYNNGERKRPMVFSVATAWRWRLLIQMGPGVGNAQCGAVFRNTQSQSCGGTFRKLRGATKH